MRPLRLKRGATWKSCHLTRSGGVVDPITWPSYLGQVSISINIGEAKTRHSEHVAAAMRGEEVVIARAGKPEVRLTPVRPGEAAAARRAEREKWFGSLTGRMPPGAGDLFLEPTFTDEEMEAFGKFPGDDD